MGILSSLTGIGVGQNPIAFPVKFAYFYEPKACYENNGLCVLWAGLKRRFSATFTVIWLPPGAERVLWHDMVIIVQSVRTPGCGPGGRGFESHWSPQVLRKSGVW